MCSHDHSQRRSLSALLVSLALIAASACGGDSPGVSPKPPPAPARKPTLTIISGDGQTAEVGSELPDPLVVALHDSLGAPMARVLVRFLNDDNVESASALTDESGMAGVRWTLGGTPTTQRITAAAIPYVGTTSTSVQATFSATGLVGPAARVQVTVASNDGLLGTPLDTVYAAVTDRFDNAIVAAPIAWLVESGGGSVRPLASATDTRGIARAIWTMGPSSGDNVLRATSVELIGRLTASASRGFPATSVVVGAGHACAIMPAGEAYCWGSNIAGQLGAGGTDRTPQPYPVRVAGGFTFTVLAAGGFHTCGLTAAGEAYCWGQNNSGQVGSDLPIATTPTRVAGAERFTALAAGMFHTCGLTIGRTVVCWGDNSVGQRGDGGNRSIAAPLGGSPLALPAPIAGGRSFVALAAGFYATCAVATTGETYCWGSNVRRELGTVAGTCRMRGDSFYYPEDYDWPCSTTPVPIDSRAALSSLTASGFATCGVTPVGDLVCWGDPFPPTTIPGARVSAAWSLGGSVCGLEGGEAVSCWGMWSGGVPIAPPFGHEIALVNLSTGGASSCGLSREQPAIVYCWGSNGQGQLGNGTTAESPLTAPVRLPRRNR